MLVNACHHGRHAGEDDSTLITIIAQVLIESRVQGKEAVRRICGRSLGGFKIPRTVIIN